MALYKILLLKASAGSTVLYLLLLLKSSGIVPDTPVDYVFSACVPPDEFSFVKKQAFAYVQLTKIC
jgi:hypothetical protein